MKIFLANGTSCSLNYQRKALYQNLYQKHELVDQVEQADVIIISETCCSTEYHLKHTVNSIINILEHKKDNAKVYITGCITREFYPIKNLRDIQECLKKISDEFIQQNQALTIVELLNNDNLKIENTFGYAEMIKNKGSADIYISNGCLNHCTFCKTSYQKYPLTSMSLSQLKDIINILNHNNIKDICLYGTNISQYGFDLYHEYKLPEIIKYIEEMENIKRLSLVGFSFSDAIRENFQDCLMNSSKLTYINGSLESGSNSILSLINKGFRSEEFVEFIRVIQSKYPKELSLSIISGFPTETMNDVKKTLEVLKEVSPTDVQICRYINSSFVKSNKYSQLSPDQIQEHTRIYQKTLKRRNVHHSIYGNGYIYNNYHK